jgi:hypothetical protein
MIKTFLRIVLLGSTLLAACASPGLKPLHPGATEAEVRQLWGEPTGRYVLPAGSRLEYATGPYGLTTWMVDLDAAGRATAWKQVLDERNLHAVQGSLPGMSTEQLLMTLGRPGERRRVGQQGVEVWAWRYETTICQRFSASVGADGVVREASFEGDPRCESRPI